MEERAEKVVELEGVGVFSKAVVRTSHTRFTHNQSSQNVNMKSHLSLRSYW